MGGGHKNRTHPLGPRAQPPKTKQTNKAHTRTQNILRWAVPGLQAPSSTPQPRPGHTPDKPPHIWWQPQEALFCWIHAHNMLLQQAHLDPRHVVSSLQAELNDPHCVGKTLLTQSFGARGPFNRMAINRYLYKHTQHTQVYYKHLRTEDPNNTTGLTRAQIMALLPEGTKGVGIGYNPPELGGAGHMKCIRHFTQDQTWYALDSLIPPFVTPLRTDQQWQEHTKNAHLYVLMQTTATPGPSLGLFHRGEGPPSQTQEHPLDLRRQPPPECHTREKGEGPVQGLEPIPDNRPPRGSQPTHTRGGGPPLPTPYGNNY
jgi:hypothetical protein